MLILSSSRVSSAHQAVDFPEEKRVGQTTGEPRQADAENVPEFTRFKHRNWVATPRTRRGSPVSVRIERRVVDRSRRRFSRRRAFTSGPPKMIDNTMPQNPDEPGALARPSRETLPAP